MPYEVLIHQLEDVDEDVRQNAAWIVGQLFVKDAVPLLMQMLTGSGPSQLRHTTAVALGRIRDPKATELLLKLLVEEPDLHVREACAIALGIMREPSTMSALKAALDVPENARLKGCIAEAIRGISNIQQKHRTALEKKIEKSKRDVAENPDNGAAHNNLGVAYYHNRQYELAMQHCDRAKTLGAGVSWLEERLKSFRKSSGKSA